MEATLRYFLSSKIWMSLTLQLYFLYRVTTSLNLPRDPTCIKEVAMNSPILSESSSASSKRKDIK